MKQEEVKEKTEGKSLRQWEREAAVKYDKGWRDKKGNWRTKRENRGARTWKAFMCSVIELEIALYSNLTVNFYPLPTAHLLPLSFSVSTLSLSHPSLPAFFPSLVSLCTWKRQACLVPLYEYLSLASRLLFMPGLWRAHPPVLVFFSYSFFTWTLCPPPCILISATHLFINIPTLYLLWSSFPDSLSYILPFFSFYHISMAACVLG